MKKLNNKTGIQHYQNGNLIDAKNFFLDALQNNPLYLNLIISMASILIDMCQYDKAISLIQEYIKQEKANIDILKLLPVEIFFNELFSGNIF